MQTNCFAFKKYTVNKNFSDGRTKQTRLMLLLIEQIQKNRKTNLEIKNLRFL